MLPRRVLMIDDHAMVREGLRLVLGQASATCELVEAGTWAEASSLLARDAAVDFVLLDLGLPDIAGLDALDRLREQHEHVPVVVLSSSEERALVLECINRGAMGFIGKSSSGAQLIDALGVVFGGSVYLPPALFGKGAAGRKEPPGSGLSSDRLSRLGMTERQVQVLELLVRGLSNKLIASRLGLSEATVKTHVAAALRALNVKNRTQAVFELAKHGHSLGSDPRTPHE